MEQKFIGHSPVWGWGVAIKLTLLQLCACFTPGTVMRSCMNLHWQEKLVQFCLISNYLKCYFRRLVVIMPSTGYTIQHPWLMPWNNYQWRWQLYLMSFWSALSQTWNPFLLKTLRTTLTKIYGSCWPAIFLAGAFWSATWGDQKWWPSAELWGIIRIPTSKHWMLHAVFQQPINTANSIVKTSFHFYNHFSSLRMINSPYKWHSRNSANSVTQQGPLKSLPYNQVTCAALVSYFTVGQVLGNCWISLVGGKYPLGTTPLKSNPPGTTDPIPPAWAFLYQLAWQDHGY